MGWKNQLKKPLSKRVESAVLEIVSQNPNIGLTGIIKGLHGRGLRRSNRAAIRNYLAKNPNVRVVRKFVSHGSRSEEVTYRME